LRIRPTTVGATLFFRIFKQRDRYSPATSPVFVMIASPASRISFSTGVSICTVARGAGKSLDGSSCVVALFFVLMLFFLCCCYDVVTGLSNRDSVTDGRSLVKSVIIRFLHSSHIPCVIIAGSVPISRIPRNLLHHAHTASTCCDSCSCILTLNKQVLCHLIFENCYDVVTQSGRKATARLPPRHPTIWPLLGLRSSITKVVTHRPRFADEQEKK